MSYVVKNSYAMLNKVWNNGGYVELELEMPVELIQSNPKVGINAGRVAIQRGPLVYCLEEVDNGTNLSAASISPDLKLEAEYDF